MCVYKIEINLGSSTLFLVEKLSMTTKQDFSIHCCHAFGWIKHKLLTTTTVHTYSAKAKFFSVSYSIMVVCTPTKKAYIYIL